MQIHVRPVVFGGHRQGIVFTSCAFSNGNAFTLLNFKSRLFRFSAIAQPDIIGRQPRKSIRSKTGLHAVDAISIPADKFLHASSDHQTTVLSLKIRESTDNTGFCQSLRFHLLAELAELGGINVVG